MSDKFKDGIIVNTDERTGFIEIYIDPEVSQENPFLTKPVEQASLPTYDQCKEKLPKVYWPVQPQIAKGYDKTWQIAFSNLRTPTSKNGFVSNFIDTAFNNYIFMWDSAFITMFGKYAHHCFPFIHTLDNLYAKQLKDGFISREISIENGQEHFHRFDPVSTGPNILPWAEWQHYEQNSDKQRLSDVFSPLLALHRWIADNRTWKDGTYWGCGWSCGMDNQLRVDKEKFDASHHSHSSWIDVTLQQYLSATHLLKMHRVLNSSEDVSDLMEEVVNLKEVVNKKMWDESRQFYFDTLRDDSLSEIKSIGPYWALLTDIVPNERLDPFIAHLDDENSFKRLHRIPTMAADCKHYAASGDYWRGGVWAPTNYMVLKGLENHGKHELAFDIALNHVLHVSNIFTQTGTIWENYSPELAKYNDPNKPDLVGLDQYGKTVKSDFVGWSGLSLISMLIEFVFGIKLDVPNKRIDIYPYLTDAYAVKQLQFGSLGCLDIDVISEGMSNGGNRVEVNTSLNLDIHIHNIR